MSEQNKAAVHRLIAEVWNRGNFAVVDELVAPNYVGHSSTETRGREGYTQFFSRLRTAFPDIQFTVGDQIVEGDRVVARWTARGTHVGEYAGLPPTGKSGVVTGITVFRIPEGEVRECWTNADELGLLQQLGVVPALTPAP
jgi:steroid delta-isomerase-like uncharacterized protein